MLGKLRSLATSATTEVAHLQNVSTNASVILFVGRPIVTCIGESGTRNLPSQASCCRMKRTRVLACGGALQLGARNEEGQAWLDAIEH